MEIREQAKQKEKRNGGRRKNRRNRGRRMNIVLKDEERAKD